MPPNEGILCGLTATCQVCAQMSYKPAVCARCGMSGHPVCMGLDHFFHFPLVRPEVTAEYASCQDSERRESWRRSITDQILNWKSTAIEDIGVCVCVRS